MFDDEITAVKKRRRNISSLIITKIRSIANIGRRRTSGVVVFCVLRPILTSTDNLDRQMFRRLVLTVAK